ncbi:MAG: hypothetical protein KKF89_02315 [Nanoarchaeota archaeon]|nr:hypothetical protein [Nanoarchaeota archaeon]MBU1854528.1 hypothetical protein [Nanoarchaeota archaeon]
MTEITRSLDSFNELEPVIEKKEKNGSKAEELVKKQRDISIAEFFEKNRHLLGFDNKRKALLTTVKEAM